MTTTPYRQETPFDENWHDAPEQHPEAPTHFDRRQLRQYMAWSLWRGRLQGIVLALLFIFFARFALIAAATVLIFFGMSRLFGFSRRRRARRRAYQQAQYEHRGARHRATQRPEHRPEPEVSVEELLQRAKEADPTEAALQARIQAHQLDMADFNRRLEEAISQTIPQPQTATAT